jgi:hypothetical protein
MALPPTGLQQQAMGMQQQQSQQGMQQQQPMGQRNAGLKQIPGQQMGAPNMPSSQTSLNQIAQTMAQSYGLPMMRQDLVDAQGNFMMTPDQLVQASGGKETLGSAAAKLNYISSAIAKQQNEVQARKAEAALQAGAGLVRSRGRGSAALMQSGYYQDLSRLYDSQDYEAADFSYFIVKEQLQIQQDLMRRAEKLQKKKAFGGALGGLLGGAAGFLLGGPAGASIGAGLGSQLGGAAGGVGFF